MITRFHTAPALLALAMLGVLGMAKANLAKADPAPGAVSLTEQTEVRLISARARVDDGELQLGLQFRMKSGWKIYWRSPGAAGFPPRLDWAGSQNLMAGEMSWPAPRRFAVLGFDTLGYLDEVVFPIAARAGDATREVALRLAVDYLTCDEICIPYRAELALNLPAGAGGVTEHAAAIERARGRVPGAIAEPRLESATVFGPAGRQVLEVIYSGPLSASDLFVEGPEWAAFGAPRVARAGDFTTLRLSVETVAGEARGLAGTELTLTLVDGDRAGEWRAEVAPGPDPETGWRTLAAVIGLALLGGLILNLMPCVLPVLSLKLMGVAAARDSSRPAVRRRFLATAAGILASFAALAGAVIALKAAGHAVGWGLQFQSPVFLGLMALVLVLFACNLWGGFEIRLPGRVADAALNASGGDNVWAHFFTGALATLLATPCSAPFLGTAVGFALARGPGEIVAIFAALGVGLAAPYLVVAGFPGTARVLPRPGRWMGVMRVALGLALAVTALWLLWILAGQRGLHSALALGGALAAMAATLSWLRATAWRWAAIAGVAVLAASGGWGSPRAVFEGGSSAVRWQEFAPGDIPRLVAQGQIVFLDVTADWCLTCKVNERTVIARPEIAAALGAPGTLAMRADWTNPDPRIAAFLGRFGRAGIPFNAVFGPGAPAGLILPELLSGQAIEAALAKAARPP
ncbi:MAG: protein-disulfide reductase DsbD family protein [Alphaproteobacteria bacterium]